MNISYYTKFIKESLNIKESDLCDLLNVSESTLKRWYLIDLNKSNPYKIKKLYKIFNLTKENKSLKEIKKIINE